MRHFLIIILWLAVYWIPTLIPDSDFFYSNQILFSLVLIYGLTIIDTYYPGSAPMIMCLILLTGVFALLNLTTQVGYLYGNYVLYDLYSVFSNVINGLELIVLAIGITIGILADGYDIRMGTFNPVGGLFSINSVGNLQEAEKCKY